MIYYLYCMIMQIKRFLAAAGVVTLLTLTGAGCSNSNTTETKQTNNDGGSGIKVTNPTDNAKVLESYVKKTFGEAKITSFLNDFPVKGATGIEYNVSRTVTQKDITAIENMLKKDGFKTESGPEEDGAYGVGGQSETHLIVFTLDIGKTKVGALLMPIPEDFESEE